jgi:hypothetical protein
VRAARTAHCVLSDDGGRPPTGGPAGTPARAARYRRPVPSEALVGALRQGAIVIQYRRETAGDDVGDLDRLRAEHAGSTLMVPDGSGMRFLVAATAWRRVLGCPTVSDSSLDAMRRFRQRYAGGGPDR